MASAASAKSCDTGGSLDSREKRPVGGRLSVRGRPSARGWRGRARRAFSIPLTPPATPATRVP